MNVIHKIFIGSIFLTSAFVRGQSTVDSLIHEGICDENGYCLPKLQDLPRTKGVELKYRLAPSYSINTEMADSLHSGKIIIDKDFTFKVRVPLIRKNNFKLFTGFKFKAQEFKFQDSNTLSNSLYNSLHDKDLRSVGLTFYTVKPFIGNQYFLSRTSFRLSGDLSNNAIKDYFRFSITAVYGKRPTYDMSWGVGMSYSNNFGKQLIFPVITYANKFTDKWSVVALLPTKIQLIFMPNEHNVLSIITQISGDNYNINLESYSESNLLLSKSDLHALLVYEREIYDFLWVSASIGGRYNIDFDLYKSIELFKKSSPEITNDLGNTLIYELSIFMVPPRKWMN